MCGAACGASQSNRSQQARQRDVEQPKALPGVDAKVPGVTQPGDGFEDAAKKAKKPGHGTVSKGLAGANMPSADAAQLAALQNDLYKSAPAT